MNIKLWYSICSWTEYFWTVEFCLYNWGQNSTVQKVCHGYFEFTWNDKFKNHLVRFQLWFTHAFLFNDIILEQVDNIDIYSWIGFEKMEKSNQMFTKTSGQHGTECERMYVYQKFFFENE